MKHLHILALVPVIILLSAVASIAQSTGSIGDRPTDLISADLGVSENAFIACFSDVQPAKDNNPSGARQHANKGVLLPCLQIKNPEITNRFLDSVMDKYRPEGPMQSS